MNIEITNRAKQTLAEIKLGTEFVTKESAHIRWEQLEFGYALVLYGPTGEEDDNIVISDKEALIIITNNLK